MRSLWVVLALVGCKGSVDDGGLVPDYWRFPPVPHTDIEWVAAYQGQEIHLLESDQAPQRGQVPASLILGKDVFLRVGVTAADAFQARDVALVVDVTSSEGTATLHVVGEPDYWDPDDLDSTFNLTIPGDLVQPEMQISVSLHELRPLTLNTTGHGAHRWTSKPLEVLSSDVLHVVFIPFDYNGAVPDTSPAALEFYRRGLAVEYPVEGIEVFLADPLVATGNPATSSGQGAALDRVTDLRETDAVPHANTYYYGLLASNEPGDGILGLSNLAPSASDAWARASVGLADVANDTSLSTMKHEIGHAHGRPHVGCEGEGGPLDGSYPYAGGAIESRHYDPLGDVLISGGYFDNMTYCGPSWWADYSYEVLYQRVKGVRGFRSAQPDRTLVRAWVDGEGRVGIGGLTTVSEPSGRPVKVQLLGELGQDLGQAEGWWYDHSHGAGGTVLVDTAIEGLASVVIL